MCGSATGILTGGLVDPAQPDYAGKANWAEKNRRVRIRQGLEQINAVYQGGTVPQYTQAKGPFDPSQQYYFTNRYGAFQKAPREMLKQGQPWLRLTKSAGTPKRVKFFTKGDGASYEGFGPDFYNKRAQDFVDYATPQLQEQYSNSLHGLMYGLANRGLLNSSSADTQRNKLDLSAGRAQQGIIDQGRAGAQQLQNQVEGARQTSINQLHQTADPANAAQSAISTASSFQAPSAFAPIGNLFSDLANQYYMRKVLNSYRNDSVPQDDNSVAGPSVDALPKV